MKSAIITGVTGQTGSYLAEQLLAKDYKVYGIQRRTSSGNTERIDHIKDDKFDLVEGDITDAGSMSGIISSIHPTEFYNMAAQSHVQISFDQPMLTLSTNVLGVANILEAIRHHSPNTKLLHAGTSEQFGNSYTVQQFAHKVGDHGEDNFYVKNLQNEETIMCPVSPYGTSKLAAYNLIKNYRESYKLFACTSICFNHESPRRGKNFLTRKVTSWLGEFARWSKTHVIVKDDEDDIYGVQRGQALNIGKVGKAIPQEVEMSTFKKLRLGNLESKRDWGFAGDYARAQIMMLQQDNPQDLVISTGETHSIKEFLKEAFNILNISDWEKYVVQDSKFFRKNELDYLLGDSTKIRTRLGWKPTVDFKQLVKIMVEADLNG